MGGAIDETVAGFEGWHGQGARKAARVSTRLRFSDRLGSWKARWGIGRMSYLVPPGLYAVGTPGPQDEVVVTANYKMTYDVVRSALSGRNVWLLVLETHGINVWCAAGKGTFGTDEVVRRVQGAGLSEVVAHRRLLLPILGAPGVAAHEVKRQTGFDVRYAAIRATDLPEYLDNGGKTTPAMREPTFTFTERLVLTPLELLQNSVPTAILAAVVGLAAALAGGWMAGAKAVAAVFGALVAGTFLAPLLLPWLPGASFALKGAWVGLAWAAAWCALTGANGWSAAGWIFALPAVTAFLALNFTGCTPFTSRSGVKKEMGYAIPAVGGALACGALFGVLSVLL